MNKKILPAEWDIQDAIQLTWPDHQTEWEPYLDKVLECYINIAAEVIKHEHLIIVCRNIEDTKIQLKNLDLSKVIFRQIELNDTWARDHAGISVVNENGEKKILDFVFNGWGLKFNSNLDNQITKQMFEQNTFQKDVKRLSLQPFVLEGGSIDTDGRGTLLATEECLCSINRNEYLNKIEIENKLKSFFGFSRILWLTHGNIIGDDTDSHIDTLARFCSEDTIAYVQCKDTNDAQYESLHKMELELKNFRTLDGKPYNLIPLPLPEAIFLEDYRLPATYANFLILNGAVLMPAMGTELDIIAKSQLQKAFPDRKIISINCCALLSGHGSLHCITMQYPKGFINFN